MVRSINSAYDRKIESRLRERLSDQFKHRLACFSAWLPVIWLRILRASKRGLAAHFRKVFDIVGLSKDVGVFGGERGGCFELVAL